MSNTPFGIEVKVVQTQLPIDNLLGNKIEQEPQKPKKRGKKKCMD